MNLIEFNEILANPDQIEKDQIAGLQEITEQFPFFQVAHYLHLKALKKRHSFKYNDHLKKTAAYTTDRSLLFDNITAEDNEIHAAPKNIIDQDKEELVEKEISTKTEELPDEAAEDKTESPEETLKVGHPLEFKSDETFSFREWLQLSSFKPIDRSDVTSSAITEPVEEEKKDQIKGTDNMDLIDKFIATNPKINTSKQDKYEDVSFESAQENESLMTETLAHVYVEQKKYDKAITAFIILSLKYPEKSSFFAHQIKAVKKLQEK